jgi:acetyltransferase-like isoleucine patch superfamily enzyme
MGKGKIIIESPIKTGIIRFGSNYEEFIIPKKYSFFLNDGIIKFHGSFTTGLGISLRVHEGATLEIGNNSFIGSSSNIICTNNIILGNYCRMGFETNVYDSNFHYIMNLQTNYVKKRNLFPIVIGHYCWIGNRSTISQGTRTPEYCIIASNSLCNKDYTLQHHTNIMIGGIPAKLLKENVRMIFEYKKEELLNNYFTKNPHAIETII